MAKATTKSAKKSAVRIELPCYKIFINVTLKGQPVPGCDARLLIGNVPTTPDYIPIKPAGTATFTVHKTSVYTVVRIRCKEGTPFFTDVAMPLGITADQSIEIILQPCDER